MARSENMDFETPQKHIFFLNDKMTLIYVIGTWESENRKEYRGSRDLQEVQEGRFQFYPAKRCQPYSPELWDACMRWLSKRDLLKAEYEQLMKKGVQV